MELTHIPVMLKEVSAYLDPQPGQRFIDCTVGLGGHAQNIAERILPNGLLLAIDKDKNALSQAQKNLKNLSNIKFVQADFRHLYKVVQTQHFCSVDGVLLDLGAGTWQLKNPQRGFSYLYDGPLDMRMDPTQTCTAKEIVNSWPEEKLANLFYQVSQERFSRSIARSIVRIREVKPILTTKQLVEAVRQGTPFRARHGRIHLATRVFQALRIVVNDELENLLLVLPQIVTVLKNDGRVVVISYHSGEDRIVKNFFKQNQYLHPLTKKPIRPVTQDIKTNPSARSAHLRAAQKNAYNKN